MKTIYLTNKNQEFFGAIFVENTESLGQDSTNWTETVPPNYDINTEIAILQNNSWSVNLTEIGKQKLWNKLREQRNLLLLQTDWAFVADVTIEPDFLDKIKQFRQELRDITNNTDDIKNVKWPTNPISSKIIELSSLKNSTLDDIDLNLNPSNIN